MKYFERLNKAKQEKQEKIERLNPNISNIIILLLDEIYEKVYRNKKISSKLIDNVMKIIKFSKLKKNTVLLILIRKNMNLSL